MPQVHVYSREQAMRLDVAHHQFEAGAEKPHTPAIDWAVISITHTEDEKLYWLRPWAGILHLEFYDLSGPSLAYPGVQLFDEALAAQVVEFTETHQDRNFVVHCAAGISRSVAVGQWISETYGHELHLHATWNTDRANSLVLAALRRKQWEAQLTRK